MSSYMTASLDLYLSKNRGDRKIVDSTKGEAVRKKKNITNKIVQEKETEGEPTSGALQTPAF